jgi:hypothetical protein
MPPDTRVRSARIDDLPHIIPLFCSSLDVVTHNKQAAAAADYDISIIKDLVSRQCFPADPSAHVHTYVVEELSSDSILGTYAPFNLPRFVSNRLFLSSKVMLS